MIERRKFLVGLGAMFAAPAIVRAASLMPVRGIVMDIYGRSPAMDALADLSVYRVSWHEQWAKLAEDFGPQMAEQKGNGLVGT